MTPIESTEQIFFKVFYKDHRGSRENIKVGKEELKKIFVNSLSERPTMTSTGKFIPAKSLLEVKPALDLSGKRQKVEMFEKMIKVATETRDEFLADIRQYETAEKEIEAVSKEAYTEVNNLRTVG